MTIITGANCGWNVEKGYFRREHGQAFVVEATGFP